MESSGATDAPGSGSSIAALAEATAYGAYFVTAQWHPDDGWRPLAELIEPAVLDAEVSRTDAALAGGVALEPRVAASTLHLGLVARLTAPLLGAAVRANGIPDLSPDTVWWRAGSHGPRPIATSPVPVLAAAPRVLGGVIERLIAPLGDAMGERYAVSEQVLWGNVAASLSAAARIIGDSGQVHTLLRGALEHGQLRGTIDARGIRRSCCLFYRVPGGGYCGDCVLNRRGR